MRKVSKGERAFVGWARRTSGFSEHCHDWRALDKASRSRTSSRSERFKAKSGLEVKRTMSCTAC